MSNKRRSGYTICAVEAINKPGPMSVSEKEQFNPSYGKFPWPLDK